MPRSRLPIMPFHVRDYLADTMHLSAEQHGAYLLLLMHQWQVGSIPEDAASQARIARMSLQQWRLRCARDVLAFFRPAEGGGLIQPRLAREAAHAEAVSEKRRSAGSAGRLAACGKMSAQRPAAPAKGAPTKAANAAAYAGANGHAYAAANGDAHGGADAAAPLLLREAAVVGAGRGGQAASEGEDWLLPAWLPADAWREWCRYRRGKRWSRRAAELSLRTLERLHAEGHDPRRVIEQSIAGGWTGLFADKGGVAGASRRRTVASEWASVAGGSAAGGATIESVAEEVPH